MRLLRDKYSGGYKIFEQRTVQCSALHFLVDKLNCIHNSAILRTGYYVKLSETIISSSLD